MARTHKPGVGGSNPFLATKFMNDLSIFCITLNPNHEDIIKQLSYTPVGLGTNKFSENCFTDKEGDNIANKNSFYGEYTFHYWIWKNYLNKIDSKWIGFCQYRKFFAKEKLTDKNISLKNLKKIIINKIEEDDSNKYDCILGSRFSVENYKISKIVKHYFTNFLLNPSLFFFKNKRTLKLHFDLYHGNGTLDSAIELLDEKNKNDFKNYMSINTEFYPHNMFICKTESLKDYYDVVFPWLKKCESIFGFNNFNDYGQKRIYGFLAERFLSFWFSKNFKVKELPIIGKDLSDYKNL